MADLGVVAPNLDPTLFGNLLPSLERACISCADLLVFDVHEIRKRAGLPHRDVHNLKEALNRHLQGSFRLGHVDGSTMRTDSTEGLGRPGPHPVFEWQVVSTLDNQLDSALGGGFPTRYLSEITGESGAGKTQLLLTLLLSIQLPPPCGLSRNAIYISTEAALQTDRLLQILRSHRQLTSLCASQRPTLSRIFSIQTPDIEAQDHILQYQLPVMVRKHDVGLVVIDSITANYRAEFDGVEDGLATISHIPSFSKQAKRVAQIVKLGALLRHLARTENVAIVVANQVSDRFNSELMGSFSPSQRCRPPLDMTPPRITVGSTIATQDSPAKLSLNHQQRWFTGWGDCEDTNLSDSNLKTPSLGLIWANQISCRVVLSREPRRSKLARRSDNELIPQISSIWQRIFKVVFTPWIAKSCTSESGVSEDIEIVILESGISSCKTVLEDEPEA